MAVKFILSQYGKHTDFVKLKDAVKFVKNNKLTEDEYLIWIEGSSRLETDNWKKENKNIFNEESMRLTYKRLGIKYIWCSIYKRWETEKKYYSI